MMVIVILFPRAMLDLRWNPNGLVNFLQFVFPSQLLCLAHFCVLRGSGARVVGHIQVRRR